MQSLLNDILYSFENDIKCYIWDYKYCAIKLFYVLELTGHVEITFGEIKPSWSWLESMAVK